MTRSIWILLVVLFAATPAAWAQSSEEVKALQKAVDTLTEGQRRIERELQEIKTLLRARQAGGGGDEPTNLVVAMADGPVKGHRSARVALVEFTDYQ